MASHILALSPIPEGGAGYRLRIAQYAPALERAGFHLRIESLFDPPTFDVMYHPGRYAAKFAGLVRGTVRRIRSVRGASKYEAVWLYREAHPLGPPALERALARLGIPLVFDFDDAVYLPNTSEANRLMGALKRPRKTAEIIRLASHVIAGSEYLAEYARRYSSAVSTIPTVVDSDVWRPHEPGTRDTSTPVIGWIGTATTTPYLVSLAGVFAELTRTHRFVLRVSGAPSPVTIQGVAVDNIPWSADSEVALFATCDIGVYPLPNDEWTRGKCGLKAIQFMACGVPVVASAVGVNPVIIEDGVSGFLVRDPEGWLARLRALLDDSGLRRRIGLAGRQVVVSRYSLQTAAPRLVNVFEKVVSRHDPRAA